MGWITVKEYALKQILSTWTNQYHSLREINRKIESEARKMVPVWLHQELTNYHKGLNCENFLLEGQQIGLVDGDIVSWVKQSSRRFRNGGRGKMFGGIGGWRGQITRWGRISSKCGIYSRCLGIWGNWGWVFMTRLDISVRSGLVDLGYLCWGWVFLSGQRLWILGWIEIDCSENMVISRKNWLWGHWMNCRWRFGVPFRVAGGRDEGGKKL